ncbi:tyrosine-protein kinase family protein [Acidipila sp. EB88]|uniref:tyrosine-protein kinase family protein n=1 Tax=Acidipila sp. EB88 TaxID=2305226 RepID=UPI000F5D8626|nr:tyrosine-protein kinase family protein [Acidipila sp. EB88]RRA49061.1 tyrosine-protein kinase family protein [Acidipila sp. EB88]
MSVQVIPEPAFAESASYEASARPRARNRFSELVRELFSTHALLPTRILLTAAERGAGVSFLCSHLAAEVAHQGGRVLLVDARALLSIAALTPGAALSLCRRAAQPGLVTLGMQEVEQEKAWDDETTPAGLPALLRAFEGEYGHLLIDAPALSVHQDALRLASLVSGTVLVARRQQSRETDLKRAQALLKLHGGRLSGAIFNAY